MRLFVNSGSPFARKCKILVRELGLTAAVEEVATDTIAALPEHVGINPFAQIPALVTDDAQVFVDST
ncbi:MAG: glutathione S-transferase N-terminal domain-containing protein, partial [Asticcacaulis sp.]